MAQIWTTLVEVTDYLWGVPLICLMVGVGLFFTIRSGFFQFRKAPFTASKTLGELMKRSPQTAHQKGNLTPLQTLSAVLAGTIGAGNIAGVATAIAIGGPGAVFWMWIINLVGMMTKMVEVSLSVAYRQQDSSGEYHGGPMHYIKHGLHRRWHWLATIYSIALFILVLTDACFVQVHTLANSAQTTFHIPMIATGLALVVLSFLVVLGGIERIGAFCAKIVPPMCIIFLIGAIVVIVAHLDNLGNAVTQICYYAFHPAPALGGFAGAGVTLAMARGASRGMFSCEAGMGTAATVHATAKTDHPIHQGMYGVLEVFTTFIICTLTALCIMLVPDIWHSGANGIDLTLLAFQAVWGDIGVAILSLAVIMFCYSSYIGFYVEFRTAASYLFGQRAMRLVKYLFFIFPLLAVTLEIEAIWSLADMAVGFIVIPNMIALLLLSPRFFKLLKEYLSPA